MLAMSTDNTYVSHRTTDPIEIDSVEEGTGGATMSQTITTKRGHHHFLFRQRKQMRKDGVTSESGSTGRVSPSSSNKRQQPLGFRNYQPSPIDTDHHHSQCRDTSSADRVPTSRKEEVNQACARWEDGSSVPQPPKAPRNSSLSSSFFPSPRSVVAMDQNQTRSSSPPPPSCPTGSSSSSFAF